MGKVRDEQRGAGVRIGVDTGGTFTDLVLLERGQLRTEKLASTPGDPSRAVLDGIARLGGPHRGSEVVHGSTVALNAVLTGRIARTALITNAGFRDLIEIGRQERPSIYELHPEKPAALVPRELRFEVGQRSWPDEDGTLREVERPDRAELVRLARRIERSRAESVAVCLLHSYADPAIEERIAAVLSRSGASVTCSAGILPAYREYERFSTAVVNAAVAPVMGRYLDALARELPGVRLSILQSSGGTLSAERARREPVRVLFSGPAGGVVGAARAAREAGLGRIATLDMGGTSSDVAFHDPGAGLANTVSDARIAGHPVAVPTLDIHTIGCGGGSLVTVDRGGILHVGPESAGADPGPVCYGRGEIPTVTDAHVRLGHIANDEEGGFLDGGLFLDTDAVARAFETLGKQLGVQPTAAAGAVLDVARAAMRRALGVMTMQRGHDPRSLPLVAFGGAGGLSAAALAGSLGMPGALVPAQPGVLSALGMATADAVSDHSETVLAPLADWPTSRRERALGALARRGREQLVESGFPARSIDYEFSLDLRYRGQSFELAVAEGTRPAERFAARHAELYGWRLDQAEVELVQLRARAVVRVAAPEPTRPRRRPMPDAAVPGRRSAWFGRRVQARRIARGRLSPGHAFEGPAVVEEFSGTTLVPPGWRAEVRAGGHLWLSRG